MRAHNLPGGLMPLINSGEIFFGPTKAPVRSYLGEMVRTLAPDRVVHVFPGKFAALGACVRAGVVPSHHEVYDTSLFSSVIGVLADPTKEVGDLGVVPHSGVQVFFKDCDPSDELDFAARIIVAIKSCQLNATNRYIESQKRDLRVRQDHHVGAVRSRLEALLPEITGLTFNVDTPWAALSRLKESPGGLLYVTTAQPDGPADAEFGWRHQTPEFDVAEFLERANAIEGVTTVAHVTSDLADQVPDSFSAVMAYAEGGVREHVYANGDLTRYAPQSMHRLTPRKVQILGEADALTRDSRCELVPIDQDTALYLRDLFVHRLGRATADHYFAVTIDGKAVAVVGLLLTQILGAGHPTTFINQVFGVARTLDNHRRLNRLTPMVVSSGQTRDVLCTIEPGLLGRTVDGIQMTEKRAHANTKDKVFKPVNVERAGTMFKVLMRAEFRPDTWQEAYQAWWDRHIDPKEATNGSRRRRRKQQQPVEAA